MVPVPSDADSPKFKTSTGSAKWVPEKNAVQWNIKSFPVSVPTTYHNLHKYNKTNYDKYLILNSDEPQFDTHGWQVAK